MIFQAREYTFDFSLRKKPLIMGILNVTPDSFSDGNRYITPESACEHAEHLQSAGADIIDIGAESTRPGSPGISAEEECLRLLPALKRIRSKVGIPISIDTSKAVVAEKCLAEGAAMINDVSGLRRDAQMAGVVKKYTAGVIVMHMRGVPKTMQALTDYDSVCDEVIAELSECVAIARAAGIADAAIMLDPGIGFAKTVAQNISLLQNIAQLQKLKRPVLLGTSRKSFIGETLGRSVEKRLAGSLATVAHALSQGVHAVRVHDVEETNDFLTMLEILTEGDG